MSSLRATALRTILSHFFWKTRRLFTLKETFILVQMLYGFKVISVKIILLEEIWIAFAGEIIWFWLGSSFCNK